MKDIASKVNGSFNEFYLRERNTWRLDFLKVIVIVAAVLLSFLVILRLISNKEFLRADFILLSLIISYLALYFIARKGYLNLSSSVLVSFSIIAVSFLTYNGKGVFDSSVHAYLAIIIISYLLLGWRFSLITILVSLLWLWTLAFLSIKEILVFEEHDPASVYVRDISVILLIIAALAHFYLKRIDRYIQRLSEELAERKRTEQILIDKEENYRYLFEQAAEGILIGNTEGKIILASESMTKITGYERDELLGKNISFLFSDEELKDKPLRYDLLKKDQAVLRLRKIIRKNGEILPVEMNTKKLIDGRYQAFFTDITERIKAEKSLKDYERIFNLSANPICLVNWEDIILKVNPAFASILEYGIEEIIGRKIPEFIHPDDQEATMDQINKSLLKNEEIIYFENRYVTKTGKIVWFSWVTQPVYAEKFSFGMAHDITHLKEIEAKLIEARDKAEESDRLKSAFLENMSHEIRTPMNGIIGFSEMIATEKLEESESKHYANIIINSGQRLLTIVDDILDISRIETGQIEIYPEAVNIDDLLKEVINFFTPRARSAGLDLQLLQTPGTDVFCLTDKTRLHQILSNLISNSFKFTQKGFVAVSCEKSDKNLLFSVRDSGIGIDPSMHEKIFERFIQEEMEPTREYGGTGLGLAISKKLTELLGGNIWLESEKGKGSIFYFTIPLEPVERPPTKKKAVVGFSNNNESIEINILVAEDDDTNFEYLDEILKKSGYGVIRASTGEEAVKIATTVSGIALVLMDIKMPVMDGYTATREIKKLKPDLPVIAQTAYAMTKDSMKAREAGCDSYIAKPILRKDLLDLLSKYLKK